MKNFKVIAIILFMFIVNNINAQKTDTLYIYYSIDKSETDAKIKAQIDDFINKLNQLNVLKISVIAYTDYLGTTEYNKALATKRAINIKNYIKEKTSNKLKIETKAVGELPPELPDNTEGIQQNRRVELIAFYKPKPKEKPSLNKTENTLKNINELEVGEQLVLKNVNFYGGTHFPVEEAKPVLKELLKILQQNPTMEIEIQGHICCSPPDEDGYDSKTGLKNLSIARAKYVYDYLIENGIDKSRLSYKGFGGSQRLVKIEYNEEDKIKNRRVEIKIIKK